MSLYSKRCQLLSMKLNDYERVVYNIRIFYERLLSKLSYGRIDHKVALVILDSIPALEGKARCSKKVVYWL